MTTFDSTAGSPGQVRFFNPGPVWVRPQVMQALTGPMLSHRPQAFMDLYGRIQAKLPKVFRTARTAHTLATSATGVWESALISCVEGPVLALCNGAFSAKWGEMATRMGLEADVLQFEWGQAVPPDAVRKKLAEKKYAAVTVVHSETSTGVISDLAAIAKVVHENSDALLFADAVTSVAGTRDETDEWGLDVVLTGSQKAFALPPGLALFAVSERALGHAGGPRAPDRRKEAPRRRPGGSRPRQRRREGRHGTRRPRRQRSVRERRLRGGAHDRPPSRAPAQDSGGTGFAESRGMEAHEVRRNGAAGQDRGPRGPRAGGNPRGRAPAPLAGHAPRV